MGFKLEYELLKGADRRQRDGGRTLYVLMHGFRGKKLLDVAQALRDKDADGDILQLGAELYVASRVRSTAIVAAMAEVLVSTVNGCSGERPGGCHGRIVLIGHSFGAVLMRKLALLLYNVTGSEIEVSDAVQKAIAAGDLARKIDRLVQISGMNRGWNSAATADYLTKIRWKIGEVLGSLFWGHLTIFDIRRGAPFLVATRLQWLDLMSRSDHSVALKCIQVLGTIDREVSPDDGIDFAIDFSAAGNPRGSITEAPEKTRFFLVEMPFTDHDDAVQMARPASEQDVSHRAQRWRLLNQVVHGTEADLKAIAIDRKLLEDSIPRPPNNDVKQVTFIVHGIRDPGFWTKKIARKIRQAAGVHSDQYRAITQSYGYFAMAPFLLRWSRYEKVEWLMDCYVEARARYPKAEFNYVGHSNGTYLLAKAMQDYPQAKFRHVVFAGSVVRRDYDWQGLITSGRIVKVLNLAASSDWVVAIFPKALQAIRWFDLGSAGHDGFNQASAARSAGAAAVRNDKPVVDEVRFLQGRHCAGHQESVWDDIAGFIVAGRRDDAGSNTALVKSHGRFVWLCGLLAPLPLLLIVAFFVSIGWGLIGPVMTGSDLSSGEAALRTALFCIYVALLGKVLTKV